MIEAHLHKMQLTPEHCKDLRRFIPNTTAVTYELTKRNTLNEVLALLYAELTGQNRASIVDRIYSKYRTLSPNRDREAMQIWAQLKTK